MTNTVHALWGFTDEGNNLNNPFSHLQQTRFVFPPPASLYLASPGQASVISPLRG